MRLLQRIAKYFFLLLVCLVLVAIGVISFAPPAILRVGSGYAAKIVCSNVFIAGRDAAAVLRLDVQAPGNPFLQLMTVSVDRQEGRVTAGLWGSLRPTATAVFRPGLGCAVLPEGETVIADAPRPVADAAAAPAPRADLAWPEGQAVQADPGMAALLAQDGLVGPDLRAALIVHDGRILAERYGEGFDASVPLLGWSMTKTVNAALIGRMIAQGKMALTDRALLPQWAGDARAAITLADLMAMQSGLAFNENYGTVADVTRMLFLEPDMAGFAARQPLAAPPGTAFDYSTGTAVLLSRIWMNRIGDRRAALAFPQAALFGPLEMTSAILEADASGTFVGGSYLYATARDWARFGLFLAQDGIWNGQRLLPPGFVKAMAEPTAASGRRYSHLQTWIPRRGPGSAMPADGFVLQGHDGQTITVVPSRRLVVVRLGLTPSSLGWQGNGLAEAVLAALPAEGARAEGDPAEALPAEGAPAGAMPANGG
ncbi:serine hydrolase [Rhizobium sp. SSA_523]|uniref:serine hydrolase domain-containing protein n=1 Tax=Rhizobium sp. SSA_523 TaxID=2952477 RepID=UPI0020916F37|nr:serine hydrolase [Rhizobium sp. SSA_523]MCO5730314.1 beta-lactamase family protein [Rhizobium sp. SSA_523]WKC25366.1 serine hydrolase [Rhizobium sp. SSA_523]